jgi:hypothetical protein
MRQPRKQSDPEDNEIRVDPESEGVPEMRDAVGDERKKG